MLRHTLIVVAVLAAGFPAYAREPVRSLLEVRRQAVIVQQWDASCGAAALATVLRYQFGDQVDERFVAESMLQRTDPLRVKHRGGFSLLDMKKFAETRGFEANGYSSVKVDDLQQYANAIVPVDFHGYPHFVVFRGRIGNSVLLADPAFGNRVVDIEAFERAWNGNIAFVISPRASRTSMSEPSLRDSDLHAAPPAAIRRIIQ